jgi:hypothetical protein
MRHLSNLESLPRSGARAHRSLPVDPGEPTLRLCVEVLFTNIEKVVLGCVSQAVQSLKGEHLVRV